MRIPRKMEHIRQALQIGQSGDQGLADLFLVPNALPEISLDDISLETQIGELNLSSPIIINAMTGGASETEEINRQLAEAARETGVAMAVGSQMSAIKNREMRRSYEVVRKVNPDGILFANLGSEATVQQAVQAIEMIGADALQIHLNVMQELLMPEGDRNFHGMKERIAAIVEKIRVPIIIKEVGFGMMAESAWELRKLGICIVDVGGTGGTNFAAIENARRELPLKLLNGWGSKTSMALLEALTVFGKDGDVIASGGIRNVVEAAKALAAGASAVGMAGAMLRVLQEEGAHGLAGFILGLHEHLRLMMTALGTKNIAALRQTPVVVTGETEAWCRARGIDTTSIARRQLKTLE